MNIVLIRHLPTEWNEEGRLQGRKNIPVINIDNNTRKLIRRITSENSLNKIKYCYSSPLLRAVESAKIYGFDEPILDERLIEFDFGKYEGFKKQKMLDEIGDLWIEEPQKLNLGETFKNFSQRVESFISEIKEKEQDSIVVFSHGFVIRYLLTKYHFGDVKLSNKINVKNNSLYSLNI